MNLLQKLYTTLQNTLHNSAQHFTHIYKQLCTTLQVSATRNKTIQNCKQLNNTLQHFYKTQHNFFLQVNTTLHIFTKLYTTLQNSTQTVYNLYNTLQTLQHFTTLYTISQKNKVLQTTLQQTL